MTAQIADVLVNEHPRLRLDGLGLYAVVQGEPVARAGGWRLYPLATPPLPGHARVRSSALVKGYRANFRLRAEGWLELASYAYEVAPDRWEVQEVGERLAGDFWLLLRRSWEGPDTYVPFRGGVVVEDRAAWVDHRLAIGQVLRGTIRRVAESGLAIEVLPNWREGLLLFHRTPYPGIARLFRVGDSLEVAVSSVDEELGRVELGLLPDPTRYPAHWQR